VLGSLFAQPLSMSNAERTPSEKLQAKDVFTKQTARRPPKGLENGVFVSGDLDL